jgi:hypothetical protein
MKRLLASLSLLAFIGMPTNAGSRLNDDLSQLRMLESRFQTAFNNKNVDGMRWPFTHPENPCSIS